MELIETVELASSASSITFSSIPQTYTDLVLKLSLRGTDSGTGGGIVRFNTGGTYSTRRLLGSGSSAFSDTGADNFLVNSSGLTANTFANASVYIPNYRESSQKSFSSDSVQENNATSAFQMLAANLWSETSAITEISIEMFAGNFVQYSSASLYGITAGSDGTTTVS